MARRWTGWNMSRQSSTRDGSGSDAQARMAPSSSAAGQTRPEVADAARDSVTESQGFEPRRKACLQVGDGARLLALSALPTRCCGSFAAVPVRPPISTPVVETFWRRRQADFVYTEQRCRKGPPHHRPTREPVQPRGGRHARLASARSPRHRPSSSGRCAGSVARRSATRRVS